MSGDVPARVLEPDAVQRIRAGRHLLCGAGGPDPLAIARRVCGLQAQVAGTPGLALLARTPIGPEAIRSALAGPDFALTWAMRGTLHLVPRADLPWYAAALGSRTAAQEKRLWPKHRVSAADEDRVTEGILRALGDGPLNRGDLASRVESDLGPEVGELLRHPWGIGIKPAVARGAVELRSRGRDMRLSLPEAPVAVIDEEEARQWLADRYLFANAIGDATSFARWSGLTRPQARAALDAVAATVVRMRDATWYGSAELTDPGPSAAVDLLPVFDPFTLAAPDRPGLCPAEPSEIWRKGGWVSAVAVRDGRALGTWKSSVRGTGAPQQFAYSWFDERDAPASDLLANAEARIAAMSVPE